MIKSKKRIAEFLFESFLTEEKWTKRDDLYNYDSFLVSNRNFLPEDIETKQTLEQKATFYKGADEALNIFLKVAELSGDSVACAGAFFNGENYYDWKDRRKFEVYQSLNKAIGNRKNVLIDIDVDIVILGDIFVGGFKYISKIGLFLRKANALVVPTHNMELLVFSNTLEKAKQSFCEAVDGTGWEIIEDF